MQLLGITFHPLLYPVSRELEIFLKIAGGYATIILLGYAIPFVRDTLKCMDVV